MAQQDNATILSEFRKIRRVSAWVSLIAFVGFYFAQKYILDHYPPVYMSPKAPTWLLVSRNTCLFAGLVSGLLGLPRWQSIVALVGMVFFVYLAARY